MKKALITGITGQDGSYLVELLLSKGYEVFGVVRRASTINTKRIDHICDPDDKEHIFFGDLADGIDDVLYLVQPDEIYNLASMSHVRVSFDVPIYTGDITGLGAARILEGIRKLNMKNTRFYQASSSEMFGLTPPPQSEISPFNPVSPYGCAKLYAYNMTRAYRFGYNIFASNGILFNHESERRGKTFVTRKITRAACRIKLGLQKELHLGNLNAWRDWGHSKDYMRAIHLILQHDTPDDFVIATGEFHSVKEFVKRVFRYLDMDWKKYVVHDSKYNRPVEVPALKGDATKAMNILGWEPEITFDDLIEMMINNDMKEARIELYKRDLNNIEELVDEATGD
jgi:GDPmannose 4,6-dehydratase